MAAPRSLFSLTLVALCAIVLVTAAATPADTTGLVLAYGFEEPSGSATDSSGNGNAGTPSGPVTAAAGRFGRALSFDGVNDVVNVADSNSLDLTTAMTLEAWVKPEGTGWRTALLKERPGGLAYALYSGTDTGRPSAEVRTTTTAETRGTASLPTGTWSHLAATYDGTTLRLYVNGTQVSSRALSGSIGVTSGALRIGGNLIWGEYFKGLIDEVRIYRRALTAGELQADMNSPIAASDTQPPSAPGNVVATVSGTDVQLAWAASTDNVGVTGYRVYRSATAGFTPGTATLVATLGAGPTTFGDANLPAGTSYYRIIAVDAAGNASAPSSEAAATIVVDQPPTAPGNLTATVVNGDEVHLAWDASTDVGGAIDQYYVYRSTTPNFTLPSVCCGLATLPRTATSYVDDVNEPGAATYYYKVTARDEANQASAPSNEAIATIEADTTPPTVSIDAPCDGVSTVSEYFDVDLSIWEDRAFVDLRAEVDGVVVWQVNHVDWVRARFEWSTRDRFANGPHVMTAVARDAAGHETVSAPCLWNVRNPVFTVAITSPADGATVSGIATLTLDPRVDGQPASPSLYLKIKVDGVMINTPAGWDKPWDTTTWPNGVHTVTAELYFIDYAGPVATTTIQVTVDNSTPLPPGLVAAYGFEELTGTAATDSSGSGSTGTISGAARTAAGKFGRALSFDGANDLVTVADAPGLDLSTGMTLEAWVRPTANTGWRTVVTKEQVGNIVYGLFSNSDTARPSGIVSVGPSQDIVRGPSALVLSSWTHLATTYDGSVLRLYVNGLLVASRNVSGAMPNSSQPLQIGGNNVWAEWFVGTIDEVRVYNRALTAAEIVADRDSPVVPAP